MNKFVKKVDKKTALNPIARAVAKQKLRGSVLDQQIKIFMMDEGQDCCEEVQAISFFVYAIMLCLEDTDTDTVDFRKLKSAANILAELSVNGFKWKRIYAVTLDNALQICESLWATIDPNKLQQAISEMEAVA
jgi:hypothetical protein